MTQPSNKPLSETFQHTVDDLRALRDQIRLKLHLAKLDARDSWVKLDQQLSKVETDVAAAGRELGNELERAIDELGKALVAFKRKLDER